MSFRNLEDAVIDLCGQVMGQSVTYTPTVGSPVTINGVFDNSYVDIDGVVSLKPTLRINLSDLASAPAKGDSVSISSVSYRVLESRADGYGGSTLILQKV